MPKYKVLVGIDYPPNKRAEAGSVVDDLPTRSIKWLRESGIIEPVDAKQKDVEPEPEPQVKVESEPVIETVTVLEPSTPTWEETD